MKFDRFMIGAFNEGQINAVSNLKQNALFGIFLNKNQGCILKRIYKPRKDTIDLTGKSFGDLIVINKIKKAITDNSRGAKWNCLCKCGVYTLCSGSQLRAGQRISCGCKAEARIIETGINRIFGSYKRKAKEWNQEFAITKEFLANKIFQNCSYCGRSPSKELKRLKTKKIQIKYNGIDRIDPTLGYTPDNCNTACFHCNISKLDLTLDEWKNHIVEIVNHLRIKI